MSYPRGTTKEFKELNRAHVFDVQLEFPHLAPVAAAQWALESGWGSSPLAKAYCNFAGMKWRPEMAAYGADPVTVRAHDGKDSYCRFQSYVDFIQAYWARFDVIHAYEGWRDHVSSPKEFMLFIGPIWVGGSPADGREYVRKVLQIHNERLAKIYRSLLEG